MTHQELKARLLETNCFEDNNYLNIYCDIIINNLETKKEKFKTNKHHIIPKCYYKLFNLEIDDSKENIVNLLYKNHILVHYYLCLCVKEFALKYKLENAFFHLINRKYKFEDEIKILDILDEYQKIYEDYKKQSSIRFKGRKGNNWTEEQRIKLSEMKKGKPNPISEENKIKQRNRMLGNTYYKNRQFTDTTKENISKAHKGMKLSEDAKKQISMKKTGFKYTEESKQKMRINGKEKYHKPVVCVETGRVFNSITAAEHFIGTELQGKIGRKGIVAEYHWCYLKDFPLYEIPETSSYSRRSIRCIEDNKIFPTLKSAELYYNIKKVKKNIINGDSDFYGHHWEYVIPEKATKLIGIEDIKDINIMDYKQFVNVQESFGIDFNLEEKE